MPIEKNGDVTVITGDSIGHYRLLTLRQGLKLEATHGMQLCRGRSAYSIVKAEFGLKGNKMKVLEQFTAFLIDRGILRPT